MILCCVLLMILGISVLSYYDRRADWSFAWLVLCLIGAVVLAPDLWGHVAFYVLSALVGLFGLLYYVRPLRLACVTGPIYRAVVRHHKPLSKTESEALQLGDTWAEASLFNGLWSPKEVDAIRMRVLSSKEKDFLAKETEDLCALLDDWQITHQSDLPQSVWRFMKEKGFMGLMIDPKYGGRGFSQAAHAACVLKVATKSMTTAITMMVPNSLGPAELLMAYGTVAQKKKYLPGLASGKILPCFGLTEPEAGSDASALRSYGIAMVKTIKGKPVKGFSLTFAKRYITLAPVADLIALAFHAEDPDCVLGKKKALGITLVLLPSDHPGLKRAGRHQPTKLPFMNGTLEGQDLFVPMDSIIGGIASVGQGWSMLVSCLAVGRSISLPALSAASSQVAYLTTTAYALMRHQFKHPLADFEGIQAPLLKIGTLTYLIESLRCVTLAAADEGVKAPVASAIAKYHTTEMARQVIQAAMDIHGGRALMDGPSNYLLPLFYAAPIGITVEGANALTRHLIIFGQGSMIDHPYLKDMVAALSDPQKERAVGRLDRLMLAWLGQIACVKTKAYWAGWTGGYGLSVSGPDRALHRAMRRLSTAYAFSAQMALLFERGKIKRKEKMSGYLADALGYLYAAHCAMVYHKTQGADEEEAVLMSYAVQFALDRVTHALYAFWDCMPVMLGRPIRFMLFPWGRPYAFARVKGGRDVLRGMLSPNVLRTRFMGLGAYAGRDDLASLFEGFARYQQLAEPLKAFHRWVSDHPDCQHRSTRVQLDLAFKDNLFSQAVYKDLKHFIQLQQEAMGVDVFDKTLHKMIGLL